MPGFADKVKDSAHENKPARLHRRAFTTTERVAEENSASKKRAARCAKRAISRTERITVENSPKVRAAKVRAFSKMTKVPVVKSS